MSGVELEHLDVAISGVLEIIEEEDGEGHHEPIRYTEKHIVNQFFNNYRDEVFCNENQMR